MVGLGVEPLIWQWHK